MTIKPGSSCLCAIGVLWVLSATPISADTIEVPGDHTTLSAALDAAIAGDTIRITDSATYAMGVYTFEKSIKLEASAGQNPIVEGSITFGADAAGSRIGSVAGGQIIFDGALANTATFLITYTTIETTFENLLIRNSTGGTMVFGVGNAASPVDVHLNFTEVIIDASATSGYGFRAHSASGNGSILNFTRCTFTGGPFQGIWINGNQGGGGTYNFHQCNFSGNQRAGFYVQEIAPNRVATFNLTECFITGGPGVPTAFRVFGSGAAGVSPITINVERSVLKAFGGNTPAARVQIFGGGTNDNLELRFRNCDLIASTVAVDVNHPAFALNEGSSENLLVTMLDCNLVASGEAAIGVVCDNFFLTEPILATNCNIVAATAGSVDAPIEFQDTIDPPIEPDYDDPDNRVFCYSNETLLAASSEGASIGSNFNFSIFESCDDVVVPPGDLGDVNGDGVINVADVTELAVLVAAGTPPSNEVGDITGDEVVDQSDVEALALSIVND